MRQIRIMFLLLLIVPPMVGSPASAEGRLFYTPSQRTALEQARLHRVTELKTTQASPANSPLIFNGIVLRSDGHNTRWINGGPDTGSIAAPTYKGQRLKPGQTVANGKIYEPHQIIRESSP